jgi:hypothetical protein
MAPPTATRNPGISFAEVTQAGWGFQAIVRACERLILMMTPTLPRDYEWNYRGIVEALWDLGDLLGGRLGSGISGIYPPGTIIDANGNVSMATTVVNGTLWFDERQGRLFIAIDGQWWQTNGAESLVHIGAMPPMDPISLQPILRPGKLWFCTLDGRMYLYVADPDAQGTPGWYEISGGGGGGAQAVPLELNDLTDVDIKVKQVAAGDEVGLLMRDNSKPDHDGAAYVITDDLDYGRY